MNRNIELRWLAWVQAQQRHEPAPHDVVGATLFFCSPGAAFVTGQVLVLDGGLTATQ